MGAFHVMRMVLFGLVAWFACSPGVRAQGGDVYAGTEAGELRTFAYTERTLELAARLAIQDGGRVKPLLTYADFQLLRLNGRRSVEVTLPGGEEAKLSSLEWLLDVWYFPQQAQHYPNFTVDDTAVLADIGLSLADVKKRDRLTYAELLPARDRLFDRAGAISSVDTKLRSRTERGVFKLALAVSAYDDLLAETAFTRLAPDLQESLPLAALGLGEVDGLVSLVEALPRLRELRLEAARGDLEPQAVENLALVWGALDRMFAFAVDTARQGPGLLAPTASVEEEDAWADLGQVLLAGVAAAIGEQGLAEFPELYTLAAPRPGEEWRDDKQWHEAWPALRDDLVAGRDEGLRLIGEAETLGLRRDDAQAFEGGLEAIVGTIEQRAAARGEYDKIEPEIAFYAVNHFMNALVLFLLGFVAVAVDWVAPNRASRVAAWVTCGAGLALLVTGITTRCLLLDRPPVATLYETILFISAGSVATALFIEYAMRRRFAIGVAAVLGATGMFLANRYEFREAVTSGDTKGPLVAVLDTNFWLATHVTTITLGYAASILASILGIAWLVGRMSGIARDDRKAYTELTRAMYGVVCFGAVLATVGTILGGIWANESWGRFWGWDPKENGALMIVLWQLVMLHARMGGYVKQFGLNLLAIVLGPVTVFSWWHVNNLEIGLHSYGFTDGVMQIVLLYYYAMAGLCFAGLVWYAFVGEDRANGARPKRDGGDPTAAVEGGPSGVTG